MMQPLWKRPRNRPSQFRPVLEALDGRDCPIAVITAIPHTLLVLGDNGGNTVQLTGQGDGPLTASIDGGAAVTKSGVNDITVFTRGGNDTVKYNLTGPLGTPRVLAIDLGSVFVDNVANQNSATL